MVGPGRMESIPSSMRAAFRRPPVTESPANAGIRSVEPMIVFIVAAPMLGKRDLRSASAPELGVAIDVPLISAYCPAGACSGSPTRREGGPSWRRSSRKRSGRPCGSWIRPTRRWVGNRRDSCRTGRCSSRLFPAAATNTTPASFAPAMASSERLGALPAPTRR